ncbi:MFS transporter (Mch2) [Sporothrix schenckii 1099-18]|uniref:MFS transporter (Mch2) n=1 Tax=Sporothrix schenckii 1099-18 TaxID=1397361 RepID=A0A0F2LYC6_SPOSC|nr:MFS transporter (Mch2) [Sporothrix schenckii 1099-18]KJR82448.1 MFS transporter (Mch2) [Sporothrix schenckii 1099-18]
MAVPEAPTQPHPDDFPHAGSDSEQNNHKTVQGADGGYASVIVGAILASYSVSWGINTTFGVYVSFLIEHDYIPGGTPLRYGFVGGLSIAGALLSAPLMHFLINKFGFRVPFVLGMSAIGQYARPLNGAEYSCSTLGIILLPSQIILVQWFDRRLGLAQGLANAGSGLGGLVLSNTTRLLIETLSLKKALIVNGAISAAVLIPCLCLLRRGPMDTSRRLELPQLRWLHHPGYIWVWTWGFSALMSYCIAMYTIASYASGGLGLSQTQAAALQSLLAAGLLVGRPLTGLLLDVGGRINVAILLNIAAGVSCWALWLPARSFALMAVFALVQGCTGGAVWVAAAPVTVEIVGTARSGSALAMFWLVVAPSAAFSSPSAIGLLTYARTHLHKDGAEAYAISIGFCGALFVLSSMFLCGAKLYQRRESNVVGEKAEVI